MSSAPLVFSPPTRRHHLSPVKPSRFTVNSQSLNRKSATLSSPTKRSLTDENSDPFAAFLASPHKRVKSALSNSLGAAPKSAVAAASSLAATPSFQTPKRAFGALLDITNSRAAPSPQRRGSAGKSVLGKPARNILKPLSTKKSNSTLPIAKQSSPPHRNRPRAPSPRTGSGNGIKRSPNPAILKRVVPPSSRFSYNIASIDSLLRGTTSSPLRSASSINDVDISVDGTALPVRDISLLVSSTIPESWSFSIYEDTPEETMQNLMEHSTHILDISDDSDNESHTSEFEEKGKENIPPTRLAELFEVTPQDRVNSMRIDTSERLIPQRRAPGGGPSGRYLREHRQALREMQKEELTISQASNDEKKSCSLGDDKLLPTLRNEDFPKLTPKKNSDTDVLITTPKSPGSPGWAIWESDHECDQEGVEDNEDQVSVAAKIPLPVDEDELLELESREEASDKEN